MDRFLIIADDFTGSNDTGVQLTRKGFRTRVVLDGKAVPQDGPSCVLDTESRNIPEAVSREKLRSLISPVDFGSFSCGLKKVDSTLRGNIGGEIFEVDKAYNSSLVVFMPALPALGRTTVGGIHMLKGKRILDTELAKDPRKPVLEDNIENILKDVYSEPVGLITCDQIRSGSFSFDGARVWACDAETDDDMKAVIAAASNVSDRVLWVGTAAMADNITALTEKPLPSLAVIASVSDTARDQLHYAMEKGLRVVKIDTAALISGAACRCEYVDAAVEILGKGTDLAVVSSATDDRAALDATVAAGKAKGMDADAVSEFVSSEVAAVAAEILDRVKISGLFLSGGDTAIHFFNAVGAGGSEITAELVAGVPMMKIAGGRFDGLKVVTKAGAFGAADVLPFIFRKLAEK